MMIPLPEDNRFVMARLACEPEFALRLSELLRTYAITDKPVLCVQARPAAGQSGKIDVTAKAVLDEFRVNRSEAAWWDGFGSRVAPRPVFHGVAGLPSREDPGWAIEAHRDAHFIGAVWNYPELPSNQGHVSALAEFYGRMFHDFFDFVASVSAVAGLTCDFVATATFFNAHLLPFGAKGDWGDRYAVTAPALNVDVLQWPVLSATLGDQAHVSLAAQMQNYLLSAYGVSRRT